MTQTRFGIVNPACKSPLAGLHVRLISKPWGLFKVLWTAPPVDPTDPQAMNQYREDNIMPEDFLPAQ